jgi:hypothetical protein
MLPFTNYLNLDNRIWAGTPSKPLLSGVNFIPSLRFQPLRAIFINNISNLPRICSMDISVQMGCDRADRGR